VGGVNTEIIFCGLPFPIENERKVKLCMASSSNPLVNKDNHIFTGNSEDGLSKSVGTYQHMRP
jgi:hypothetical protein